MDADTRLAEIRSRVAAASKAPWTVEAHQPTLTRRVVSIDFTLDANLGYLGYANRPDAEFIAAAPEDIPYLLASVADRDAEITELRTQLEIAERRVDELAERLAEAEHSLDTSTSDDQAGAPV